MHFNLSTSAAKPWRFIFKLYGPTVSAIRHLFQNMVLVWYIMVDVVVRIISVSTSNTIGIYTVWLISVICMRVMKWLRTHVVKLIIYIYIYIFKNTMIYGRREAIPSLWNCLASSSLLWCSMSSRGSVAWAARGMLKTNSYAVMFVSLKSNPPPSSSDSCISLFAGWNKVVSYSSTRSMFACNVRRAGVPSV